MVLNRKIILLYTILFVYSITNDAFAKKDNFFKKNSYCYENNLGWKFYCDDEEEKEENIEQTPQQEKQQKTESYRDKINRIREQVEETKAKAILEPTEENVKNYMYLQQKVVNQASFFSDVWRRILWSTPELDYTQQRPVSSIGKNVWQSDRENKILNTLKNINKRYGLFFIYSSGCGFCQKYSQILYDLKKEYKVEIRGISVDGVFLPQWETNSFINTGQLEELGIDYSTVPVTVLYDNLTNNIILVGYGLMTQDELMGRIYVLTQTKVGEDY